MFCVTYTTVLASCANLADVTAWSATFFVCTFPWSIDNTNPSPAAFLVTFTPSPVIFNVSPSFLVTVSVALSPWNVIGKSFTAFNCPTFTASVLSCPAATFTNLLGLLSVLFSGDNLCKTSPV